MIVKSVISAKQGVAVEIKEEHQIVSSSKVIKMFSYIVKVFRGDESNGFKPCIPVN